jgi:hypothetical protein
MFEVAGEKSGENVDINDIQIKLERTYITVWRLK